MDPPHSGDDGMLVNSGHLLVAVRAEANKSPILPLQLDTVLCVGITIQHFIPLKMGKP